MNLEPWARPPPWLSRGETRGSVQGREGAETSRVPRAVAERHELFRSAAARRGADLALGDRARIVAGDAAEATELASIAGDRAEEEMDLTLCARARAGEGEQNGTRPF